MFYYFQLVLRKLVQMLSSLEKSFYLLLSIALTMSSCVNLKYIGEFSKTSIEGIEKYEELPQSFSQICAKDCEQKNIRNFKIHKTQCDCDQDEKADSITRVIYATTRDYFYGLNDIADNKLTKYQTVDLSTTLATGDFGPVKLNEADVNAYSKVSTLVLRAFTDGYRRNKIKEYVVRGHEPLKTLLHFLELNLSGNLIGKLEVQKSSIKNYYFDFVSDKKLSSYERTKFAEDYFRRISEIETKQEELTSFSEILQEIADGHNVLYTNINNLEDDEVKGKIARLGRQLKNTITSLSISK